jgi:CHAD domain-containing protein
MKAHLEIERKYDVARGVPVPELLTLPKVATVEDPRELQLEAVYFDTESQDLRRGGVTLRKRIGGDDAGWHLKLRLASGDREELSEPLPAKATMSTEVPEALGALVQVHARGRALAPVATVRSQRVVYRLLAKDGAALGEFCDDNVTARATHDDGSATVSSWREWEIELRHGTRNLLTAADELFIEAGARPSGTDSKLARALGAPESQSGNVEQAPSPSGPAGLVLLAHLRQQVETLKAFDPRVRRDEPDSVHKMRVATRRLRSAFATFEPLITPASGVDLQAELKWLAGILGEARDAEVMRERLLGMAAEDAPGGPAQPADEAQRPDTAAHAAQDLSFELAARYRRAHDEVLGVLNSPRYFRLLDALDLLLSAPPWTSAATEPAHAVLPALVLRDWRRVKKRAANADQARGKQNGQDKDLHRLRKSSKRLRYACEALIPLFGAPATDLATASKQLQEVLGEHQDSLMSQALLRELAADGALSGESVLVLGRLHLLEQQHADRSHARFRTTWEQVADKRLRRWLKP